MDQKLEIIKQNVVECTKCDLCKTRTNSVPGKGNFHSDVIFVGEAPGKNEDEKGEPFIGIAGKKLSIALEEAGISREEVYITNIVKCRPPKNRVPTATERETCQDYLKQEISIIKPKIIGKINQLLIIPNSLGKLLFSKAEIKSPVKISPMGSRIKMVFLRDVFIFSNRCKLFS